MRIAFAIAALVALPVLAEEKPDPRKDIERACLDYVESWYEADGARMERALHPELAKRIVNAGADGKNTLGQMGALTLINGVKAGHGAKTPKAEQQKDVTILDVFENAATAKVIASGWVDYLHLARWNGQWKIVNVLWERKPAQGKK